MVQSQPKSQVVPILKGFLPQCSCKIVLIKNIVYLGSSKDIWIGKTGVIAIHSSMLTLWKLIRLPGSSEILENLYIWKTSGNNRSNTPNTNLTWKLNSNSNSIQVFVRYIWLKPLRRRKIPIKTALRKFKCFGWLPFTWTSKKHYYEKYLDSRTRIM